MIKLLMMRSFLDRRVILLGYYFSRFFREVGKEKNEVGAFQRNDVFVLSVVRCPQTPSLEGEWYAHPKQLKNTRIETKGLLPHKIRMVWCPSSFGPVVSSA
uniref:Uncharacterized protein n=1 Tax=Ombrophytum subterraneum TaxID=50155 RepID=A0A6M8Q0I0_9MAGN|nr:hypothetical protein [Ombrophytum subterraneum]